MTTAERADIFIVDMGQPNKKLLDRHGPFSRWFLQAFAALNENVVFRTCSVAEAVFDDLAAAEGVILSGAEEGVYDDLPWRNRFDAMAEKLIATGKLVLGICFSHQYLMELLGGRVEHHSEREENGYITVELTEAGRDNPLFNRITQRVGFLAAHNDMVVEPAPGSVLLATNDRVPVQSFGWGDNVWGVQFHPEMTPVISRDIVSGSELSPEEKNRRLNSMNSPQEGLKILENFLNLITA